MKQYFAYLYGVPRSGSTLVYRVLNLIFPDKNIFTAHHWKETDKPLIVTYRDFRDIAVSYWRTSFGRYDKNRNLRNKITVEQEVRDISRAAQCLALSLNSCKKYYEDMRVNCSL